MIRLTALCLASLAMAACMTAQPAPARLDEMTPASREALSRALAQAVGRASVQLGPLDLTREPAISVLPPQPGPLEGASLAMPELFELVVMDARCYVRRNSDRKLFPVEGLTCRPIS